MLIINIKFYNTYTVLPLLGEFIIISTSVAEVNNAPLNPETLITSMMGGGGVVGVATPPDGAF